MGYESRVIIAKKSSVMSGYAEDIAELNLCKVSGEFLALFTSEYKGNFYDFYGSDARVTEDKYGKPLTYTTFRKVHKWLLDNIQKEEHYRRYDMLLALMNSIRTGWADEVGDFIIIHYGY